MQNQSCDDIEFYFPGRRRVSEKKVKIDENENSIVSQN